MLKIDPEQERQRLAKLYEALSDQELQEVGNNRMALTDWAFEAVRAEMLKRGLDWIGKDMPLPSEMIAGEAAEDLGNRPVVLRRYRGHAGCVCREERIGRCGNRVLPSGRQRGADGLALVQRDGWDQAGGEAK